MKVYYIFSQARSGTHLISNVISNSYSKSLYRNDCRLVDFKSIEDSYYSYLPCNRNDIKVHNNFGKYLSKIDLSGYDAIIYSDESRSCDETFLNEGLPEINSNLEEIIGKFDFHVIQNVRDPRNIAAGCMKMGWDIEYSRQPLLIMEKFLKHPQDITVSIYDLMVSDEEYLRALSRKLSLDEMSSIESLNTTWNFGGGSTIKNNKNYNSRYQGFEDDVIYKNLVTKELVDLYNEFIEGEKVNAK